MIAARQPRTEVETELKISLSPQDMEEVFKTLAGKEGASEISHKYRPRAYYDTPDLDLYKANLSLRVQYKPGKGGRLGTYEQTVKLELPPDAPLGEAVLLRKECKDTIPTPAPDLAAVTDPQAQTALKPFQGKKLMHIFTAAMERRFFELEVLNGKVEVAFDAGYLTLAGSDLRQDFSEIEVEVKRGDASLIDNVKKEILSLAPSAKVQPLSKSAQGSRLYLAHKK